VKTELENLRETITRKDAIIRDLREQRAELIESLNGILAITDRNHNAWERARAAIRNAGGEA
jgi:hypothetical protein